MQQKLKFQERKLIVLKTSRHLLEKIACTINHCYTSSKIGKSYINKLHNYETILYHVHKEIYDHKRRS